MVTTYDPEAGRLAEYFLAEDDPLVTVTPERVHGLALAIQTAIEDWFLDHPAGQAGPLVLDEPRPPRLRLLLAADAIPPDDEEVDDDDEDEEEEDADDQDTEQPSDAD